VSKEAKLMVFDHRNKKKRHGRSSQKASKKAELAHLLSQSALTLLLPQSYHFLRSSES
jgi:hypothetical protein